MLNEKKELQEVQEKADNLRDDSTKCKLPLF